MSGSIMSALTNGVPRSKSKKGIPERAECLKSGGSRRDATRRNRAACPCCMRAAALPPLNDVRRAQRGRRGGAAAALTRRLPAGVRGVLARATRWAAGRLPARPLGHRSAEAESASHARGGGCRLQAAPVGTQVVHSPPGLEGGARADAAAPRPASEACFQHRLRATADGKPCAQLPHVRAGDSGCARSHLA
jgi:hypothetical protein